MEFDKVVVVGKLHQDLVYRTTAYSDLAKNLAKNLLANLGSEITEEDLETAILKIIDDSAKKISGNAEVKRGGNGNNSTELLAKLQIPLQLMTTVGQGVDWMFPELQGLGINTSTVYQVPYPTPISTIIQDPQITKIFVAPNLKAKMNFETIEINDSAFDGARIIFFTPIADKYTKVLQQVQNRPIISAFTLELQKIQNLDQLKGVVPYPADLVFANLNDAAQICGLDVSQTEEELLDERLTQVEEIMKNYAHIRVYTLGKYGSWICIDSHSSVNIPVFKVEVMNRTGAGDTFAAGFIAYMFEHILNVEDFEQLTIRRD